MKEQDKGRCKNVKNPQKTDRKTHKTSVKNEQPDKITKNSGMASGKNGSKVYVSRGTIRFWRCVSCETKAPQKCLKMQKNSRFSMIFRRKLVV